MALFGSGSGLVTPPNNRSPFRFDVWVLPIGKPDCGSRFVTLIDAVTEIGKVMFPQKWDGSEVQALTNDALYNLGIPRFSAGPMDHVPPTLREQYSARTRAHAAMYAIGMAGREDKLETFVFVDGPLVLEVEPIPQRASFWYGSDRLKHFYTGCGQVRLSNGELGTGWILLGRDSLNAAIEQLPLSSVTLTPAQAAELPAPLKLALDIYSKNPGIVDMKPQLRRRVVQAGWRNLYPSAESNSYIDAINTVLGNPDLAKIAKAKVASAKK